MSPARGAYGSWNHGPSEYTFAMGSVEIGGDAVPQAGSSPPPRRSGQTQGTTTVKTIDYIYRFDPKNPSVKQHPHDAEAARKTLEDGNRMFSKWMDSCRTSTLTLGTEPQYVVPCNGL